MAYNVNLRADHRRRTPVRINNRLAARLGRLAELTDPAGNTVVFAQALQG